MTDREKVIKGLECCIVKPFPNCEKCPYTNEEEGTCFTMNNMLADALALLKAQEPYTGRWVKERDRTNHWHCSKCGNVQGITARVYRYCPNCGARMEVCEE